MSALIKPSAVCGMTDAILMPHSQLSACWHTIPDGAPGNCGKHADIWKENTVVLDSVQGIMHFTEGQAIELKLKFNLRINTALVSDSKISSIERYQSR